jgi:hypothetical protein
MRLLFITFHPRFTTAHPMLVITDRRLHTGVTTTGYVIIVSAAVAINPNHACRGLPLSSVIDTPFAGLARERLECIEVR